jgi:carbonic anhydrase
MSITDEFLRNAERYAASFTKGHLPMPPAKQVAVVACMDARPREIILIHHTDCGMLTFKDDAVKAAIESDTGVRPPFALEAFGDAEKDVVQSLARIAASPFIPHKDQVRGFVYDVQTGDLREIKAGVAA